MATILWSLGDAKHILVVTDFFLDLTHELITLREGREGGRGGREGGREGGKSSLRSCHLKWKEKCNAKVALLR